MIYRQFDPHPVLRPYIDAYWVATGESSGMNIERILPDGCIDIILNPGEDCLSQESTFLLEHKKAYLVWTMTRYKKNLMHAGTWLIGIRFKPAGFSAFYNYPGLYKIADETVEFKIELSPNLDDTLRFSTTYLDHFFLKILSTPKRSIAPLIADIRCCQGQIGINTLADKYFTTVRQLQRHFNKHLGISPKEFISLVRYQSVLEKIRSNPSKKSLALIAYESGYYDHSHLTNEIKKYTGLTPAQF
jgi:AraC-like DNA-binding protein